MDIEAYIGKIDGNVVFAAAKTGKMTREMVVRYMGGLHYLLTMTPVHLVRARDRALAIGDAALAAHFQHKLEEEVGHDAWAENDLNVLRGKAERANVIEGARAIARNNERLIDEKPAEYLAYIAFVEYLTVVVGPQWLQLLEERCGIPRNAMSAVGNHVELDREHAEEGFSVMDDLVGDPRALVGMREALNSAITAYEAFCAEAVGLAAESGALPAVESSPALHVSAA